MDSNPRIHIVDDDAALRESMAMLLEALDYPALAFGSGEAFLAAFDRAALDCALIDVRMTGMDGFELAAKLRVIAPSLPVILMSGHGDAESAARARSLGIAHFIEKPFRIEELQRAISAATAPGA